MFAKASWINKYLACTIIIIWHSKAYIIVIGTLTMLIASAIALYDFTNEDQEIGLFYLLVFTDEVELSYY